MHLLQRCCNVPAAAALARAILDAAAHAGAAGTAVGAAAPGIVVAVVETSAAAAAAGTVPGAGTRAGSVLNCRALCDGPAPPGSHSHDTVALILFGRSAAVATASDERAETASVCAAAAPAPPPAAAAADDDDDAAAADDDDDVDVAVLEALGGDGGSVAANLGDFLGIRAAPGSNLAGQSDKTAGSQVNSSSCCADLLSDGCACASAALADGESALAGSRDADVRAASANLQISSRGRSYFHCYGLP